MLAINEVLELGKEKGVADSPTCLVEHTSLTTSMSLEKSVGTRFSESWNKGQSALTSVSDYRLHAHNGCHSLRCTLRPLISENIEQGFVIWERWKKNQNLGGYGSRMMRPWD